MSEKAQNEADTNNLDMFSQPHSSSSHHRPGHSGAYRRHESPDYNVAHHHSESHHHGTPQHHDGSHHSREFQDLQDNPSSYHSSQSHHHGEALHHGRAHSPTALGPAASHGIVSSHDAFGEDYFNDGHHHSSRMHHSGAHHVGSHHGESSLHVGSQHTEYSHHVGSHHSGSHHHGRHHHYGSKTSHHTGLHRGERSRHKVYHHEDHHLNREHHHGLHRYDDSHSNRQYREYPQVTSQLSIPGKTHSLVLNSLSSAISLKTPHPPGEAQARGMASSITQALSRIYSLGSQLSSKVPPKDPSSKDSVSWDTEDEQFQKRKTGGRSQRAHRRMHAWNRWLWEKLSYCIEEFRKMIWNLTHSLVFEVFIFFVICLNTVMLVVQTFAEVEIRGEWYFTALDSVFFCIYVLEALLKIIALGFLYFRDMWNNLDFFIMIIAMLDFMLMQLDSFSIYQLSLFRVLKVFKSLRALRAIRVLRKLSVLTSLHEVTETLARSLPSITAILILMFTCLFLFSVVLRALFRKSDPKRFQSIFTTIFTLFTMLTLDDWSLIYMDSRAQGGAGPWMRGGASLCALPSLVIAVLVDNFQMALLKGLGKVKQEVPSSVGQMDQIRKHEREPEGELSEGTMQKQLLEKKFGAMTEKQQELLFHYLQLVAGVENQQQKFRSQAFIIDEIVDVTFEAGEEDFRR
uniref:Cation channel sperm associated 1 n=1 Tax=Prolemur simus TaxID=1328070 RepID=A0A8C9AEL1_PROSS